MLYAVGRTPRGILPVGSFLGRRGAVLDVVGTEFPVSRGRLGPSRRPFRLLVTVRGTLFPVFLGRRAVRLRPLVRRRGLSLVPPRIRVGLAEDEPQVLVQGHVDGASRRRTNDLKENGSSWNNPKSRTFLSRLIFPRTAFVENWSLIVREITAWMFDSISHFESILRELKPDIPSENRPGEQEVAGGEGRAVSIQDRLFFSRCQVFFSVSWRFYFTWCRCSLSRAELGGDTLGWTGKTLVSMMSLGDDLSMADESQKSGPRGSQQLWVNPVQGYTHFHHNVCQLGWRHREDTAFTCLSSIALS